MSEASDGEGEGILSVLVMVCFKRVILITCISVGDKSILWVMMLEKWAERSLWSVTSWLCAHKLDEKVLFGYLYGGKGVCEYSEGKTLRCVCATNTEP